MNRATPLDTANSKSSGVGEAANHARLPLERALQGLVKLGRVLEVDDVDVAVGGADDAQVVADVHRVHALLALHGGGGPLRAEIPVLDCLVPRSGHDHGGAVGLEEAARADGLVVGANDNVLLRGEVADLDVFVGRGGGYLCSILYKLLVVSIFVLSWSQEAV